MWGQDTRRFHLARQRRIIPTRVGTSFPFRQKYGSFQDHPHACGDKTCITIITIRSTGSSPRVWGQDSFQKFYSVFIGIIPTRVGTSYSSVKLNCGLRDHPHACGDKISSTSLTRASTGSSPRVWGQVCRKARNRQADKDHPHACGDKQAKDT